MERITVNSFAFLLSLNCTQGASTSAYCLDAPAALVAAKVLSPPAIAPGSEQWYHLLVSAGIEGATAKVYQRTWAHIAVPADPQQIPFTDLKSFNGVKVRSVVHDLL